MKENLMDNYLPNNKGKELLLYQDKTMFRFNTDTVLLGNFLKVKKHQRVLDVGTNNGALLLYASVYEYKELVGIDIQKEALELAKLNLERNGINNFHLYHSSLQGFKDDLFDVIICNPPYFKNNEMKMTNENEALCLARHEINLTLDDLFKHSFRLLKDKGSLYIVHRSSRIAEIIIKANEAHFGITRIKHIYDDNNEIAGAVLVEVRKNMCNNVSVERPETIKR